MTLLERIIPPSRIDMELRWRVRVASLTYFKRGTLDRTERQNMKIAWNVLGVLLVIVGSIWFLQGINVLLGSFMSGQSRWEVRGGLAVIVGLAMLLWGNRKRHGAA